MNSLIAKDLASRLSARDCTHSYIVSAPAGSGKTELLCQRYLALLAQVERPEEILAITFTRKAANEMRHRILSSLSYAQQAEPPKQAHALTTYELARAVLAKEAEFSLLKQPSRLRIQTIDSFCAYLTSQMPLSAGIANTTISDFPQDLYQQAARELLYLIDDENSEYHLPLQILLRHLDNQVGRAIQLLASMAQNRDQWLPFLGTAYDTDALRSQLEHNLQLALQEVLRDLIEHFPKDLHTELHMLVHFACSELNLSPFNLHFNDDIQELDAWRFVAPLLLTQSGDWRKTVTKQQGFPAPSSARGERKLQLTEMKNRMEALLAQCRAVAALDSLLAEIPLLPDPVYQDTQWLLLESLLVLLPVLCAKLQIIFAETGTCDFVEVGLRALTSLGSEEDPTDLTLALDCRLSHILVDEFQDTSYLQFRLLEKLTAGWQTDDLRTLFLVGDPMQSIYRFRKAEVSLFLRAKQHGLGEISLKPLQLHQNFRSAEALVQWNNQIFSQLFPASHYAEAIATQQRSGNIVLHPHLEHGSQTETIVAIVQEAIAQNPDAHIAILVQARSHLGDLLARLSLANIRYNCADLANLQDLPVTQDLFNLTRALLYPADRLSWLALLRAPWCALTLSDLHEVSRASPSQPLYPSLLRAKSLSLTGSGRARLTRVLSILHLALENRGRMPLSEWVQLTWQELGGPATLNTPEAVSACEQFFEVLSQFSTTGKNYQLALLAARLKSTPVQSSSQANVEIMTIHKAKGLEFEIVLLPALERTQSRDDARLLLWHENYRTTPPNLLLATIREVKTKRDAIYHWVASKEQEKNRQELRRLFYVATTRAKQQLHLLYTLQEDSSSEHGFKIKSHSLLHTLADLIDIRLPKNTAPISTIPVPQRLVRRLKTEFLPESAPELTLQHSPKSARRRMEVTDAQLTRQHIGTVTHRLLYQISIDALSAWDLTRIEQLPAVIQTQLTMLGVPQQELAAATETVSTALRNTLTDPKGRWILSAHEAAQSEYALTVHQNGLCYQLVVDRTFIDPEGSRWIIDYKISDTVDPTQYSDQLATYGNAFAQIEQNQQRLALYYPLLGIFHEF